MQTALKKTNEFVVSRPSDKRTVKMDGNVAYISSNNVRKNKPVADAQPAPKAAAKTVAKPVARAAVKPAAKTAVKTQTGIVSTLVVLLVAFIALSALVSRYAVASSIGAQNNAIKSDIKTAQARVDELQLQIEMGDDLQYVQDTALNELKMTYPTPEQKIRVELSN